MQQLPSVGGRAHPGKSNVTSLSSSKMMLKKLSQLGHPFATPLKQAPAPSETTRESHMNRTVQADQSAQLAGRGSPQSANPFSMTISKTDLCSKTFEAAPAAGPTRSVTLLHDKRMKLVSAARSRPALLKVECRDRLFPMKFKTLDQNCRITVYTAFNQVPSVESYATIHFGVRSFFLEKDPSIADLRFVGLMIEVDQVWSHFVGCSFKGSFHNFRRTKELLPAAPAKQEASEDPAKKPGLVIKLHHKLTNQDFEEYQTIHLDFPESTFASRRTGARHRRAEPGLLQEARVELRGRQPSHRGQLPELQRAVAQEVRPDRHSPHIESTHPQRAADTRKALRAQLPRGPEHQPQREGTRDLTQRFVATVAALAYYAKRARGLAWIQVLFAHRLLGLLQNSTQKLLAKREREVSLQKKIFSKVRLINRFVVPILRYRNYAKSSSSVRNTKWWVRFTQLAAPLRSASGQPQQQLESEESAPHGRQRDGSDGAHPRAVHLLHPRTYPCFT